MAGRDGGGWGKRVGAPGRRRVRFGGDGPGDAAAVGIGVGSPTARNWEGFAGGGGFGGFGRDRRRAERRFEVKRGAAEASAPRRTRGRRRWRVGQPALAACRIEICRRWPGY